MISVRPLDNGSVAASSSSSDDSLLARIAPTWDTNATYAKDQLVMHNDVMYRSQKDENSGHKPVAEGETVAFYDETFVPSGFVYPDPPDDKRSVGNHFMVTRECTVTGLRFWKNPGCTSWLIRIFESSPEYRTVASQHDENSSSHTGWVTLPANVPAVLSPGAHYTVAVQTQGNPSGTWKVNGESEWNLQDGLFTVDYINGSAGGYYAGIGPGLPTEGFAQSQTAMYATPVVAAESEWWVPASSVADQLTNVSSGISTLQQAIDAETSARETADSNMLASINYVGSIVSGLNANLQNETTNRTNADAALQSSLDYLTLTVQGVSANVADEMAARSSGDTTLQTNLTAETTNRTADVATLSGRLDAVEAEIDTERTQRYDAIGATNNNVTDVANDLASEVTARTNGDAGLQSSIDAIIGVVTTMQTTQNAATSSATANTLAKRDGSGGFSIANLTASSILLPPPPDGDQTLLNCYEVFTDSSAWHGAADVAAVATRYFRIGSFVAVTFDTVLGTTAAASDNYYRTNPIPERFRPSVKMWGGCSTWLGDPGQQRELGFWIIDTDGSVTIQAYPDQTFTAGQGAEWQPFTACWIKS